MINNFFSLKSFQKGKFTNLASVDAQALAAFNSLIAAGFTCPQGLNGINAAFKTIKTIYGTSDITTAISFFGDPSLAYEAGAGSGTTLGQAIRTLPNIIDPTRATDAVQTTAASQPLLLVHSGVNYLFSPRVVGNFCSTPSAAANSISGNIDIRVYYQSNTSGIVQTLLMKGDASAYNYAFDFDTSNIPRLIFGGFTIVNATATINPLTLQWYRVTRNSTTGDVIFYTSNDGITYTQLGSTVSTSAGNLPTNSLNLIIGENTAFANNGSQGKIYRATISNSIGGAPVVDFNPNQYNASTSQTQWTSSTGEVWSINTATTNNALKGALVDRTYIMGNGTSMGLSAASLNINRTAITNYTTFKKYSNSIGENIIVELGTNANLSQGFNLLINGFAGFESQNIFANVGRYNNNYSNNTLLLGLRTGVYNINNANEADPYLLNNSVIAPFGSSAANNNTAAMNATGYNLLNRNNASLFANALFSSNIVARQEDNSTIRAAMYNYIRSINNNAF